MIAPNYKIRLGSDRRKAWESAAKKDRRTLAAWIKAVCDEAAARPHRIINEEDDGK